MSMDFTEGMNRAMAYVEDALTGEVSIDEAARVAACTTHGFRRTFTYLTGQSFMGYVKRRRMSRAAEELTAGAKVLDLALKYGYESPTAFNRAFQSVHGISPVQAKKAGAILSAYPALTFVLSLKGDEKMNYSIEERKPIRIVGYKCDEPMTMDDCYEKVAQFWQKVAMQNGIAGLCAIADGSEPEGVLGVSTCDNGEFSGYFIAIATKLPVPNGMEEYTIPAGKWAIFDCVGTMPAAMQNLQRRILTEWLPASGYEYASAPDIEVYPEGDQSSPSYRSQVWLPITPKK